ncbi:cation diffusion facilitator family transporter [Chryseobacterium gleum]|uniref:cation diffusion facilitator family transporter n=1 Tax=Chryseobacterium gleum TaxID=250 RepID=UPI00103CD70E|nr:cation diffusion facilitator family transporter [Chryseobacterium gleum]MCD9615900.1 cation diffusion facilitator family transporter [Chryseobacterium gleum]MCE4064456.1 cation diffusion facilitator family transporter [Chryseobacterium gleum]QBJ85228.1 cation transporter [Chryseobacterium gleum]
MNNNQKSIYSALAANLLIALTKFIAGSFTNSSSMISEGIHSTVDTANQLLILYGIKRSKKAPDQSHPFGYGKELYFWSFVVSILIFGLGGALSIYQGVAHIMEPEIMKDPFWNYIVLFLSLIFEGTSFIIAIKAFNQTRNGMGWWDAIVKSKDPSSFLVVFEDGAAVAGLIIVMILMWFSHSMQIPELDGLASVIVGLLLVFVSFILARESRSLLMGEGIASETRDKITRLAEKDAAVVKVKNILSTYQSPEEVILMLIIDLEEHLDTEEITEAIQRIRTDIKNEFKFVRFVIIQPE